VEEQGAPGTKTLGIGDEDRLLVFVSIRGWHTRGFARAAERPGEGQKARVSMQERSLGLL